MTFTKPKSLLIAIIVSVLAAGCSKETPESQIKSAKDFLSKNDDKSALIQLKNVLQTNPDMGEARFLLGTVFLQQGNTSAAEIEFRKALEDKHPEYIVIPELAHTMLLSGQTKKLVEQYGSTNFNKPEADSNLQTTLANAYIDLNKADSAEMALTAALSANPEYAPALMIRARQKSLKDPDGGLALVEGILSKAPANYEAWKLKGDILLHSKAKPDDALVAFRKSIEISPKFLPSHLAALATLMQQNKLDEASTQLDQLKKIASGNPETKFVEAQLAYLKKDFKLAKSLSDELVRLASNNTRVLQLAGTIEFLTGEFAQAETYLTRAIQADPQNDFSQRLLISTFLRSGQADKALASLKALMAEGPFDPKAFSLAGEVYLQTGDAKAAEIYFSKALQPDPSNVGLQTALAVSRMAGGQSDLAFNQLESIAESSSGTQADVVLIRAHMQRKEFAKALAAVAKLEAKQPDKPDASTLRGRIQLAQKDVPAARKSFEKALAIDPSYYPAAATLAALDVADKKLGDARKRFESVLAKNPKNGQAMLGLTEIAAMQGAGKDELAALLKKAVEANPGDIGPRLLLTDLYLKHNDTNLALATAQGAVSAIPTSMELLDALGRAQQASGDLNQAIATFTKVTTEQPLSPSAQLRLADAHHANKNNETSEQIVRKALQLKPDYLEAQRALILLQMQAKKYQDAILVARSVQLQRPKEEAGFVLEGDIAAVRKDFDAAAAAYRAGLGARPSPLVAVKLHSVLLVSGKTADADRFATEWLKSAPKDVAFLSYLGDTAISRKDYASAQRNYSAVLQAEPDHSGALNNLAWVTLQLKGPNALAYAEKANSLSPNQPFFMDTLASVLSAAGEHAKAVEIQRKALKIQPSSELLKLNLAKIYIAAGDKSKAKDELEALAKLDAQRPHHLEAVELLKTLQ